MTEAGVSQQNNSLIERGPLLERAQQIARDVVLWHRRRGAKHTEALASGALDLDVSPWRLKALYYRDGIWAVAKAEHDRLLRRWGWHMDQRMAELAREMDALKVQREQLDLFRAAGNLDEGVGMESPRRVLRVAGEDGSSTG